MFQGSEAKSTLPSKNEHFLRSMLRDAIEEQIACGCRYCNFGGEGGQECSMQPFPKRCITFVDMMGSLELEEPRFRCQKCHREHDVHPMSIGYFPATPMEPTVWFSEALMVATSKVMIECATAMRTWCITLEDLHAFNGFSTNASKHLWQLGPAIQVWQQVEQESTSL